MIRLIAERVVHSIPVLFLIVLVAFVLIHLAPGDPVKQMLGIYASPHAVAAEKHNLGLDKPLATQLFDFYKGAVVGNFGQSFVERTSVRSLILIRIPPTLYLLGLATLVALVVSLPLAVISALRRNRVADHSIRLASTVLFAMPSFWLGLMLALVFGLRLHWLPVSGYGTGLVGVLRSLALPALTLSFYLAPMMIRTLRSSLIETLELEYIEAVRARGVSELRVIGVHAMRNSLVPLVSIVTVNIGFLLSGAVIVENVFAINGLGSALVNAVSTRDYPLLQGLVVVFGVLVIAVNLIGDVLYRLVDPRVLREAPAR